MAINASSMPDEAFNNYLLQLFLRDVQDKLTKAAIEAIRPQIELAAKQAALSMKPALEMRLDRLSNEVAVLFSVNGQPPEKLG